MAKAASRLLYSFAEHTADTSGQPTHLLALSHVYRWSPHSATSTSLVKDIMWQVFKSDGMITLMSATGCYLEYYSTPHSSSTTRRWKVDVRPRLSRPQLMIDTKSKWVKLLANLQLLCSSEREVNWVLADCAGNINDAYWGRFLFDGRDLSNLEKELSQLVALPTTLCIRAGRHGQPTPLCVNLPRSNEPMHVILFLDNTTGSDRLVYPDVSQQGPRIKLD
ncbi:hypothetical protein ACQ4PT_069465 [Festuca glaucescens]